MHMGAAVGIKNLVKTYGDFTAVDNVSLDIKPGEFLTLLGSSGSGKTTTLMAVAGFTIPDSGSITIGGQDIARLPPEKRGLGVVFQSYALFPNYNVFDNVAFALKLRGVAKEEVSRRVDEVLELVDLSQFKFRRIPQLSGGQQQRVALARAIVFSPPVLLMDEPLGALDRKLRDQLQTEIKRIQRELGVTVIYVTHDQEEAMSLSDRIAIMSQGRIVQIGTPDEVYESPSSAFVASFLGDSNLLKVDHIRSEAGIAEVRAASNHAIRFRGRHVSNGGSLSGHVMMIRPEAVQVGGQVAENRLIGTVRSREFLGPSIKLTVDTAASVVTVRVPRLGNEANTAVDAEVTLSWRTEDAIVFPAQ